MLDALKSLFARTAPDKAGAAPGTNPLQLAACALLLELAHADLEFTADERQLVEEVAMRHFDLDEAGARALIAVADEARRESVDLHQFTEVVRRQYDEGQRMVLAELMWRVIGADGRLSEHETLLARKLANLLDIGPGYLSEARRRAEDGDASRGGA